MSKKNYQKKKVFSYVLEEDIERLKTICKKYGYKSIYQLLQYLIYCFLRVADPINDKSDNPIPEEIENTFIPLGDYEKHHNQRKQKRNQVSIDDIELIRLNTRINTTHNE